MTARYNEGLGSGKIPSRMSPAVGLRLSDGPSAVAELVKGEAMSLTKFVIIFSQIQDLAA